MSRKPHAARRVSELEFEQFCELFYTHTGIRFGPAKRYFVDRRLLERLAASGKNSVSDYLRLLQQGFDSEEMQALVDVMTVNETYFFREESQLDVVAEEILPGLCASRPTGASVRLWSVPCASGEEPYSVAIKMLEAWRDVDRFEVEIFGSDIDSQMVLRARDGFYSERSVHRIPKMLLSKYFGRHPSKGYRIIDGLRESVSFSRVNVLDRAAMRRYVDFDVILCRNLLIYFDDLSRRKVIDTFFDALAPGGVLLLGASESIGRASALFGVERRSCGTIYRKPLQKGRMP